MSDPTVAVKSGAAWRAAALACVAFAGCTVMEHRQCEEFPSIHGPCSWPHSAWQASGFFAFSAVSTAALMVAGLWVAGVPIFRGKR